jgi:aminoglycoside phosphotransferase
MPAALAAVVDGREWVGVPTWSATAVWRLDPPGHDPFLPPVVAAPVVNSVPSAGVALAAPGSAEAGGTVFVKVVGDDPREAAVLEREAEALARLTGRLPVPGVLGTGALDDGRRWLVAAALPGADGRDPIHRAGSVEPLLVGLGRGLRAVHDLPKEGWPPATVAAALTSAGDRVAAGLVDADSFSPAFRRYSAVQLYERAVAMAPKEPDPTETVVCHGDYNLANVLLIPGSGTVSGYVDWGRAGLGDPHRDLATLARTVARHLSPEVVWRVLDAYGRPHPDPARLDFWALLDELR